MKQKLRKIIILFHCVALIILFLDQLLKSSTVYQIQRELKIGIEILIAATGLLLFVFFIRPFKAISIYFSIYPLLALLAILTVLTRSLVFGLLLFWLISPVLPDQKQHEKNGFDIYTRNEFMAPCCKFILAEPKFLILERRYNINLNEFMDVYSLNIESDLTTIRVFYASGFNSIDTMVIKK